MKVKNIKNTKKQRLSKLLSDELGLGFNKIQQLIRNKDAKVDGKRVSKDIDLDIDVSVEVYLKEKTIDIIFENKDILVVFKPRNIETVSEIDNENLKNRLEEQLTIKLFAVHRLDRNTEGLVIFAKNQVAKQCLDNAIKNRKLEKFYLAKVIGVPEKKEDKLIAYLKKDDKKSCVYVQDVHACGFEEIKTNYKTIKTDDEFSLLEIELVTGKTHQIRAHLSHIGYPILGDEKYGNNAINKKYNKRYQCLCAYKLVFHFENDEYLNYLDSVIVELEKDTLKF